MSLDHLANACDKGIVCHNCSEEGHVKSRCPMLTNLSVKLSYLLDLDLDLILRRPRSRVLMTQGGVRVT